MRLKRFIKESILSTREDVFLKFPELLNDLRKMDRSAPVLWKGWSNKMYEASGWLIKVKNDRGSKFFGDFLPTPKKIIEKLNFPSPPVFTTTDHFQSVFFGHPYIFVPIGSYVTYYNPEMWDLNSLKRNDNLWKAAEDEAIDKVVSGYKNSHKIPQGIKGEVLIIIDEYWLVSVSSFMNETKGKLKTFKNAREIKKYGDVVEVLENFMKFFVWKLKKQIEDNPDFIKVIRTWKLPKSWLEEIESVLK